MPGNTLHRFASFKMEFSNSRHSARRATRNSELGFVGFRSSQWRGEDAGISSFFIPSFKMSMIYIGFPADQLVMVNVLPHPDIRFLAHW